MNIFRWLFLRGALALMCITLSSCGSGENDGSSKTKTAVDQQVDWVEGTTALDELRKKYPSREIVALFTSRWFVANDLYKSTLVDCFKSASGGSPIFLVYDCTKTTSLGFQELEKVEINYAPVVAISYRGSEWDFTSNGSSSHNVVDFLVSEVSRIGAKQRGGTAPRSDSSSDQ